MAQHDSHSEAAPATVRRAATALASLFVIGAGLAASPAIAAADEPATTTTTTPGATTTTPDPGTTTTPTGTATTPASTTSTTATTTTTTATTTTTTATTPSSMPPVGAVTTPTTDPTTTTVTTTTTTATTPVAPTPAPGDATAPVEITSTTVSGTKSVPAAKGRTHRQRKSAKGKGRKARHGRRHHKTVAKQGRTQRKQRARRHQRHQTATTSSGAATLTPVPAGSGSTDPWSNTVMGSPFTPAQLASYAALVGAMSEPPRYLVRIYKQAARRYRLPWQLLAAINYVETDYGRDLRLSPVGAEGWMQFMPGTWAEYGMNVDARGREIPGVADPWQPRDAIFSAARYLAANGAPRNLPRAVFAYNHARWYVQEVLSIAERITTRGLHVNGKVKRKIYAMRTTARILNGMPYVWGGGHTASWGMVQVGYDCSGFVSAVLHAGGYLKVPATTQTLPDDPAIKPGPGRYVTIFDRTDGGGAADDHVIIDIDGQFWESGGGGLSGAARVHRMWHLSPSYLQSFNLILHPRGL